MVVSEPKFGGTLLLVVQRSSDTTYSVFQINTSPRTQDLF